MSPLGLTLVGLGRAGRARRAAIENHPSAELVRLTPREDDALARTLADPRVEAVVICTPNTLHEGAVRAALEADRHVCVEYPLAADAARARELLDLARARRRVLHVGHIELISPSQEQQRRAAEALGLPRGGTLSFQGALEGWIADPALAGTPALLALARLHRLLDLFGPARCRSATLTRAPGGGYALEADLLFESGGETRLVERRSPGASRQLRWAIECQRGALRDPAPAPVRGLFVRDLDEFLARVTRDTPPSLDPTRILQALELVGEIERVIETKSC